jgi:putative nucleotidyltransferase with HDIG domain
LGNIWEKEGMNSFEPQDVSDLAPGVQLGHYVLMDKIAEGGMGSVYKAFEPALERFVAIKVLLPEYAQNEQYLQNFEAEAQRVASIQHPNIVPIYYIGRINKIAFFSMAFIEGQTLDDWIMADKKLNLGEAKWFLYQAASALEYAARFQLIHLDIKPSNFLVDQKPMVLLADFGLAQNITHSNDPTDREVYGTPYYIAPEQIYRQRTDLRTDIYSLGATLFHLVVGQPPYDGDSIEEIIQGHIQKPFPYGLALASNIHIGLAHLIRKMMERNPDDRFQNYHELQVALEDVEHFRYEVATTIDFKPIPRPPDELPTGKRDLAYGLLRNTHSEWAHTSSKIDSRFTRAQIIGAQSNRAQPLSIEKSAATFLEISKGQNGNIQDLLEASEKFKGFQHFLQQLSPFLHVEASSENEKHRVCLDTLGSLKSQSLALLDFSLTHEFPASTYFQWNPLWQHQIAVAFIVEDTYDLLGLKKTGVEFAAGLFHDIGKMILSELYPLAFFNVMNRSIIDQLPLSRLELDLFGIHHGEIGARWLQEKRFPSALVEAVELHESMEFNPKKSPLPAALHSADHLARQLRIGYSGNGLFSQSAWEESSITKMLWENRKTEALNFENFTAFLISRYSEFPMLF